ELTDLIVVNKADGANERPAKRTMREYRQILHVLQPASPDCSSTATVVSSINRTGFERAWEIILEFTETMQKNNYWETRRDKHTRDLFKAINKYHLNESFYNELDRKEEVSKLELELLEGKLTVAAAVDKLFE